LSEQVRAARSLVEKVLISVDETREMTPALVEIDKALLVETTKLLGHIVEACRGSRLVLGEM
jgi:hypothetical protein